MERGMRRSAALALVALVALTGCGGEDMHKKAADTCSEAAAKEGVTQIKDMKTSNDGVDAPKGWIVEASGKGVRDGKEVSVICFVSHLDTGEWSAVPVVV